MRSPLGWTQDSWLGAQRSLRAGGGEESGGGGAEGQVTHLGVTLGPGWGQGVVAGPGQQCPRRARMSGGREAEKQESQLQTGSREGARGPGPTSALLARALSGRGLTCQELPFPASSATCPGHLSRASWA